MVLSTAIAHADTLRVATFAAPLSRDGPGLLLRDLTKGDAQIDAIAAIIAQTSPDILLLTNFDYDYDGVTLRTFADHLAGLGASYPYLFATRPNSGTPTGVDMDGNGRLGEARDAQGYGRFAGDGGLAILSRAPILTDQVQDYTDRLWQSYDWAEMPVMHDSPFPSAMALSLQRLSSTAHWVVPIDTKDGPITLLAFSATPPVFDGPEDRNGLRNRDEIRFWQHFLDGELGPVPQSHFVLLGNANLDPHDAEGRTETIQSLLNDPRLQDPEPRSEGGQSSQSPDHSGDPSLDTVDWPEDGPGNLRVSYVLPSADWVVEDSGVFWPDDPGLLGDDGLAAGSHRLVWVDLRR
ncbi:endonuclease/exonuclease/phosphatase family protein [Aestuariibius sp. HNIBRBA575]|uniref:endonuclease/exonuclease/phosphatase family protein n=1 Tax=Aestuariibius sp. HNIBRBA575 TaxID=3233343 RepID=UPI0034A1B980